jgi:DNA-3-methyladenine glycosylase I
VGRSVDKARRRRCGWGEREALRRYHDEEWGVPQHHDGVLFEFLVLEGMQAGLSWETILRKREAFRTAFAGFDPEKVARFGRRETGKLQRDEGIVRNRAKIEASIDNAKAFLRVRDEFGSFDRYVWRFDDHVALSRDLVRRGFRFVGPTIVESFMQAVGLRNDHEPGCYRRAELRASAKRGGARLSRRGRGSPPPAPARGPAAATPGRPETRRPRTRLPR